MTSPATPAPLERRLAERLRSRFGDDSRLSAVVMLLRALDRGDRRVYRSVAALRTPYLDAPMRGLADLANFSKPWFATATVMAAFGGPRWQRAALDGVAAIAATSFVVNQPMKLAGERRRPQRTDWGVPDTRWVRMPASASFPSGHAASAAAFCVAVSTSMPQARWPLRAAAAAVAFSRVYTGVHYPGDVLVGASVGAGIGRVAVTATSWTLRKVRAAS